MRLHQRAEETSRTIAPAITSPLSVVGAASGLRATPQRSPFEGPQVPVPAAATWGSAALGPVSAVDRMTAHLQMRAKDPMAAIGMRAGGRVSPLPGEKTPDKTDPNTSAEHDDVRHESPVSAEAESQSPRLQREARPGAGPPKVDAGEVRSRLGAGASLPVPVVQKFSNAYGHDLSSVRVHSANSMADQIGARAFTVGRDVAFAPGEYRPGTSEGDRLIGHELAHVVQQTGGEGTVQAEGLSGDAYEKEADRAAEQALSGGLVPSLTRVGGRLQKAPPTVIQKDDNLSIWFTFRGEIVAVGVTLSEQVKPDFDANPTWKDFLGQDVTDALSPGGTPLPETTTYVKSSAVTSLIEADLPTWVTEGTLPTLVGTLTARAEVLRKQKVRAGLEAYLGVTGTVDWNKELPGLRASIADMSPEGHEHQSELDLALMFLDMLENEVAGADPVAGAEAPPALAQSVYDYAVSVYEPPPEVVKLFSEKHLGRYLTAIAGLKFVPKGFDITGYEPFSSSYADSKRESIIDRFVDQEGVDLATKYVLDEWTRSGWSPETFLKLMDLESMRAGIIDYIATKGMEKALADRDLAEALRDTAADKTRYGILKAIVGYGQRQEAYNQGLPALAQAGFAEHGSPEERIFEDPYTYYDANVTMSNATHTLLSSVQRGARVEQAVVEEAAALVDQGKMPKAFAAGTALGLLAMAFENLRREVKSQLEKAKERVADRVKVSYEKIAKILQERAKTADEWIQKTWIPELKKVALARVKANYDELKNWLDHFEPETAAVVGRYQLTAAILQEVVTKLESGETTSVSFDGSVITKSDLPDLRTTIKLARAKAAELSTRKGKDKKKEDLQKAVDAFNDVRDGIDSGKYKPVEFGPSVGEEAKKNLGIGGFEHGARVGAVLGRRATATANPFQAWAIERWKYNERMAEESKNLLFMGVMALVTVASFLLPGAAALVFAAIDVGIAVYTGVKHVQKASAAVDLARLDIDQSIGGVTVEEAQKALRNAWIGLVVTAALAGLFGVIGGRMAYKGIQARRLPHFTKLAEADAALAGKLVEKVGDTKLVNSLLGKFGDGNKLYEALAYVKDGKQLIAVVDKVKDADLARRLLIAAGNESRLAPLLTRYKSLSELEVLLGKASPRQLESLYNTLRATGMSSVKVEAGVARVLEHMPAGQANRLLSAGLDVETAVAAKNLTGGSPEALAALGKLGKAEPAAAKSLIKTYGNEVLAEISTLPGANARTVESAILKTREARIPRQVAETDLYTPIRELEGTKDVDRIAEVTGFASKDVQAAKQHFMFDEHIMIDDVTGQLYRGRFTPYKHDADLWMRVAKGGKVSPEEVQYLKQLVGHEKAEGALLKANPELREAFLREGTLKTELEGYLKSLKWDDKKIASLIESEPKPITPYRYAHIRAHFGDPLTGVRFPNPSPP